MKKKTNKNTITGYIEGYYGKLLSWESRELIIQSLHKNNMNTYFYAPQYYYRTFIFRAATLLEHLFLGPALL